MPNSHKVLGFIHLLILPFLLVLFYSMSSVLTFIFIGILVKTLIVVLLILGILGVINLVKYYRYKPYKATLGQKVLLWIPMVNCVLMLLFYLFLS